MEVDLRGFDRLVAEPQCDHRTIDPRLEQRHGGDMSENMRCDALVRERRAHLGRERDVFLHDSFDRC